MTETSDPFVHHPVLRNMIVPPEESFFRTFDPTELDEEMKRQGRENWRYPDETREAIRREALAGRWDRDLWVFAYGSLMWNPGFHFREVRRARIHGYHRAFCLYDIGGARGSQDAPGLMAALDEGHHCDGLVFRIAADVLDRETAILFRREMLTGSYRTAYVAAETGPGPVEPLTFVANHDSERIRPDLTRAEQVRFIATGTGRRGSSLEYLENLAEHFSALGIDDPDVFGLLDEVTAWRNAR